MLNLIGMGLGNEKDITLKQLEILKKCDFIYLENYTSKLNFNIKDLEKLIGKEIIISDRELVETKADEIIKNAKDSDVAVLIKGDVFSATTHIDLFLRAKDKIEIKIYHNASIITAVGDCGLSLYNFGKISSIPFNNLNIVGPLNNLKNNLSLGMHSLFLLDLNKDNFMDFKEGLKYLLRELKEDDFAVVLAGIGKENIIKYGKINNLLELKIEAYPQSIIIPGKLHFIEEEMLNLFVVSNNKA